MKAQTKYTKLSLAIAVTLSLSACIEVDDDSNNELTAALQEQNRILTEQLNQSQQTNTVAISGIVMNRVDDTVATTAVITVKTQSTTYVESMALTDGRFTVAGLPSSSDVEIIISSTDDSFLTRVFYGYTGESSSGQSEKDLGTFSVYTGKEYSLTVLDSETNMPISNLIFKANANSGSGSSQDDFLLVSTFDETSGSYKIVLPTNFNVEVRAELDQNRDGILDFVIENNSFVNVSGTKLTINSRSIDNISAVRLSETSPVVLEDVQLRMSIVNEQGQPLSGANVVLVDQNNNASATFDEATRQYVIDAKIENSLSLQVPAFSVNGINYQSFNIGLDENVSGVFSVSLSNANSNSFFEVDKTAVLDFAVRPRINSTADSNLEVVVSNDPAQTQDNSLVVFYSQPVAVEPSSVSLFDENGATVIRGDDSDQDAVIGGNTIVTFGKVVEITSELSLNSTKLSVIPTSALRSNSRYQYSVGFVKVVASGENVNISADERIDFVTPDLISDTPFSINDLKLDNNNYTTNGVPITVNNTAGVPSNVSDSNNSTHLYIPSSVNQLRTLSLNATSYVRNGVTFADFDRFELVRNSSLDNLSRRFLISSARNENVRSESSGFQLSRGTALPDGEIYQNFSSQYFLSDNTDTNANSVTFDYVVETKAGETTTGTITLPVL